VSDLGSADLVISQVYGGGGNSGAKFKNDFIEIFNRGSIVVNLSGWSVQYASASGTTQLATNLSGTIQPGHYYLVQEAQGSGGTTSLPAPDATGTTNMSATSGRVRIARPDGTIADLVGYGSTATFEGTGPALTLSNTTAALRAGAGCTDTDNNAADFTAGTVAPRNSASPTTSCGGSSSSSSSTSSTSSSTSSTTSTSSSSSSTTSSSSGGSITLPSPTLAPLHLSKLVFGAFGDTRPAASTTSGYPTSVKTIIGSIFSGLQAQGVPFAVAGGDYAFSSTSAGSAVPQYNDFMTARKNFAGTLLPTMGNHECNGFTDSNCPIGSFTGMTQDYVNTILKPSTGQSSPYFSALYLANDGSWSAKFVFVAANAWNSTQQTWLQATLAVPTTYTFAIRHEPNNDARAPGVTPSESLYQSAFSAGRFTLSITGHTHLVQLPGGTQPYGDQFGSTLGYEIILGNAGAPLDAGPAYGYGVATRRDGDGAIVIQLFQSADSSANPITPNTPDTNFRFAVNPNGSPNPSTTLP
jgi:hypothetical protein